MREKRVSLLVATCPAVLLCLPLTASCGTSRQPAAPRPVVVSRVSGPVVEPVSKAPVAVEQAPQPSPPTASAPACRASASLEDACLRLLARTSLSERDCEHVEERRERGLGVHRITVSNCSGEGLEGGVLGRVLPEESCPTRIDTTTVVLVERGGVYWPTFLLEDTTDVWNPTTTTLSDISIPDDETVRIELSSSQRTIIEPDAGEGGDSTLVTADAYYLLATSRGVFQRATFPLSIVATGDNAPQECLRGLSYASLSEDVDSEKLCNVYTFGMVWTLRDLPGNRVEVSDAAELSVLKREVTKSVQELPDCQNGGCESLCAL